LDHGLKVEPSKTLDASNIENGRCGKEGDHKESDDCKGDSDLENDSDSEQDWDSDKDCDHGKDCHHESESAVEDSYSRSRTLANTYQVQKPVLAARSFEDHFLTKFGAPKPSLTRQQDYIPPVETRKEPDFPYVPVVPFIDFHGAIISGRPHRKGPFFASASDAEEIPRTLSAAHVNVYAQVTPASVENTEKAQKTSESTPLLASELFSSEDETHRPAHESEGINSAPSPSNNNLLNPTKASQTSLKNGYTTENGIIATPTSKGRELIQLKDRPLATGSKFNSPGQARDWSFDDFQSSYGYSNAGTKHDGLTLHWVILFAIIIASLLC
jgi:hypothetical protein